MKNIDKVKIASAAKGLTEAQLNNPHLSSIGRRRVATMSMQQPPAESKKLPVATREKPSIPMMPDVVKRKAREAGKNKISDMTGASRGTIDGVGNLLSVAQKQRYDRDMFGGTMSLGRNSDFGSGGFGLSFSKDF